MRRQSCDLLFSSLQQSLVRPLQKGTTTVSLDQQRSSLACWVWMLGAMHVGNLISKQEVEATARRKVKSEARILFDEEKSEIRC